jgi:hypothetical protein
MRLSICFSFPFHNDMATVIDAVGVNLGSMEIALAIGLTLFGIVLTQGYTYFRTCEQDRISLKALVRLANIMIILSGSQAISYNTMIGSSNTVRAP